MNLLKSRAKTKSYFLFSYGASCERISDPLSKYVQLHGVFLFAVRQGIVWDIRQLER